MRFTGLRLLGFKSFVEPTEFVIENGLTGVVGPNGCGKSNLVEAMRWVMGENSYKNMRASGMDDVIFSGSGNRPARNTAEVGLTLDNSDRTAPAVFNDADEIQVSRRIERESGSAYRINGKEARARDVQLLFADASTGARSPSMVGQGRIGELIQAKPQARRQLLEEAAGISGLHSRRHEAELRLRAAETNLERLDDVTGELEGRIDSLRRQARQASRFKALSADIRQADAALLHVRWTHAKAAEVEAESGLSEATASVAEAAQTQMEAAKNQALAARTLPELRDNEAKAAAALQRLQIARAQIEEEAARVSARSDELNKRMAQLDEDIARDRQLIADNGEVLDRLDAEEKDLQNDPVEDERQTAETKAALDAAAAALADSEDALGALTRQRAEAVADRDRHQSAVGDLGDRLARLERRGGEVRQERKELEEKASELTDPAEIQAQVVTRQNRLDAAGAASSASEQALEDARSSEEAARKPVEEARAHKTGIETEARTIARMLNASGGGDLFPAVADRMVVQRGYETALGAALGDDLDMPLDRAAPAHWAGAAVLPDDPALPGGVTALAEVVEAPAEMARRLAQIGVVTQENGAALHDALVPGQILVTREGALWRWDGYVSGADAPTAAALRLGQKNRLAELESDARSAAEVLEGVEAELAQAQAVIGARQETHRVARADHAAAQSELADARDALAAAEKASADLASRRAVIDESLSQLAAQTEETHAGLDAAQTALGHAADPGELDTRLATANEAVASDRQRLLEARSAQEEHARQTAARSRRLEAIAAERTSWETRAQSAKAHIATLEERAREAAQEAQSIAGAPDEIDANRRKLMSQLSEAETLRKKAGDVLVGAEERQRSADKAATDAIASLSAAREHRGRVEERLLAARERRSEGEARIREVLECEPHEAMRLSGLVAGSPLPEADTIETQLDRLKIERERLGAVNLRAEEEQADLSDRLKTIVDEREDVVEAIGKLRAAIQGLNREGRERLLAAFDVVNGHFERLFIHLFGGGSARLHLVESDDPLDAGLEIIARPPGKKPQTMTLLSGGEQALTAMALIFAVFLTNPAPICVLDEVDAPLDDHNVERFCNLMDEMANSTETRFVIITHNPITMARMNRLFGVTMAEQGVSQLVSVDLETAEQLREAV